MKSRNEFAGTGRFLLVILIILISFVTNTFSQGIDSHSVQTFPASLLTSKGSQDSEGECAWVSVYPQHIEYATVLDSDGMSIIASRRNKIYITHDGGNLWEPYSELDPDYLIRQIIAFDTCGEELLVNAISPRQIRGLYLTSDGGEVYKRVLDNPAYGESICFSPDTSLIVAATSKPFDLYISKNHGLTWECRTKEKKYDSLVVCTLYGIECNGHYRVIAGCNPPLLIVTDDTGRSLKFDSVGNYGKMGELPQIVRGVDSTELYSCLAFTTGSLEGSIFHSTNSGDTWKRIKSPSSLWSILPDNSMRGHIWAGQYNKFDPNYPQSSILETFDGGKDWQECGGLDGRFNWMLRFTPDRHAIILASEKGLYKMFLTDLSSKDPPITK